MGKDYDKNDTRLAQSTNMSPEVANAALELNAISRSHGEVQNAVRNGATLRMRHYGNPAAACRKPFETFQHSRANRSRRHLLMHKHISVPDNCSEIPL